MTRTICGGRLCRIHVNKHRIASNLKHGSTLPTITVKRGTENYYGHAVEVRGPVTLVTEGFPGPDGRVRKQLSCGARVYMETRATIVVHVFPEAAKRAVACSA